MSLSIMTLSFREYLTFHDLQATMIHYAQPEGEFQNIPVWEDSGPHTADYGYEAIYKLSTTSILQCHSS